MQEDGILQEYNVLPSSTIILNLRLRGGAARLRKSKGGGCGPRSSFPKGTKPNQEHIYGGIYFKDVLQGKLVATTKPAQTYNIPSPYIVEQLNHVPELTIYLLVTHNICTTYVSQVLICRISSI